MELTVQNLNVTLQNHHILKDINLTVHDGEFLSLLGPSGCGKTTLLKAVAGLLEISDGDIRINDESVIDIPPEKRGTVIVFQDLRLFPHMTVGENIQFPMKLAKVDKIRREERVKELLHLVQLDGLEKRKISQLSGGQQQRVALARAFAADPRILLLDEPFSGLDEDLREEMGQLVLELREKLRITTVMVTHDRAEAVRLSDRIARMKSGEIIELGPAASFSK